MIKLNSSNLKDLKITSRLICEEMLKRGWKIWVYSLEISFMEIERKDGKKIEIFSSTPSTTTYLAALRADNKFLASSLHKENNLPVPASYLVSTQAQAVAAVNKILKTGKMAVIKPIDEAHGNGVSVGHKNSEDIKKAYDRAKGFSEKVIIQEHVQDAIDVRFSCINYKFVAGLVRIPARVKGDGRKTIRQLIETENAKPKRGENYMKSLNIIDFDRAKSYLGGSINSVPEKGKYVTVLGTANMATGGETIDVTDTAPKWLVELAEKAAIVSKLPVCGVDFMLSKEPKLSDKWDDLNPVIIEINSGPGLFLHVFPTYGKPRPIIEKYVDYLATID